jgi:integrase
LKGRTINKALTCLNAILNQAYDDNLIGGIPKIEKAALNPKTRDVLTAAEARQLFINPWEDFRAYAANLTAAATGLRMGELLGLQWGAKADALLSITRAWNQTTRKLNASTKTQKSRVVPVPEKVDLALEELKALSPWPPDPGNFFFYSTETQSVPMDGKRAMDGLYAALQAIGITEEIRRQRNLVFHSWRHFANSLLIEHRVPLQKVQAVIGHSTGKMTENYFHASGELDDIRKVQGLIFEPLQEVKDV